ncbi:hypothetical protein ACXWTF_12815 [Thiomicrolovo sp. ZZH C-3]
MLDILAITFIIFAPLTIFVLGMIAGKKIIDTVGKTFKRIGKVLTAQRFVVVYLGLGLSILANNVNDIIAWNTEAMMLHIVPISFGIMLVVIGTIFFEE